MSTHDERMNRIGSTRAYIARTTLAALALLATGCADRGRAVELREPEARLAPTVSEPREVDGGRGVDGPVVIITIDGVRWQEMFGGSDLHALGMRRGAFLGAPGRGTIAASGPNYVSQPGYEEILGGRAPRCTDNKCGRTALPSLLDEARAAGAKVAAFASWERIDLETTAAGKRTTGLEETS